MSSYQIIKSHWQFSFPGIFEGVVVNVTLDFTMMCAPPPQIAWFILQHTENQPNFVAYFISKYSILNFP